MGSERREIEEAGGQRRVDLDLGVGDIARLLAVDEDRLLGREGDTVDLGQRGDLLALEFTLRGRLIGGHEHEGIGVEVARDAEAARVGVFDRMGLNAVDLGRAFVGRRAEAGGGEGEEGEVIAGHVLELLEFFVGD